MAHPHVYGPYSAYPVHPGHSNMPAGFLVAVPANPNNNAQLEDPRSTYSYGGPAYGQGYSEYVEQQELNRVLNNYVNPAAIPQQTNLQTRSNTNNPAPLLQRSIQLDRAHAAKMAAIAQLQKVQEVNAAARARAALREPINNQLPLNSGNLAAAPQQTNDQAQAAAKPDNINQGDQEKKEENTESNENVKEKTEAEGNQEVQKQDENDGKKNEKVNQLMKKKLIQLPIEADQGSKVWTQWISVSDYTESEAEDNEELPCPTPNPNDIDMFQVKMDVRLFSLEELSVRTVNDLVVIEGYQGEKKDELGYITRSFTRNLQLPEDVNPEDVTCKMTSDGYLVISAPGIPWPPPREVPITQIEQTVREYVSPSAPTDNVIN